MNSKSRAWVFRSVLGALAVGAVTGCQTSQSASSSQPVVQARQENSQGVRIESRQNPWAYPERAFTPLQLLDKVLKFAEAGLVSRERFEREFGVTLESGLPRYGNNRPYYVSETGKNWFFKAELIPPFDQLALGIAGELIVELPASKSFCLNRYKAIDYVLSQGWEKRTDQLYEARGIDGTHWGKRLSGHDSSVYLIGGPCVARIYIASRVMARK